MLTDPSGAATVQAVLPSAPVLHLLCTPPSIPYRETQGSMVKGDSQIHPEPVGRESSQLSGQKDPLFMANIWGPRAQPPHHTLEGNLVALLEPLEQKDRGTHPRIGQNPAQNPEGTLRPETEMGERGQQCSREEGEKSAVVWLGALGARVVGLRLVLCQVVKA